ncbi:macrolide 2'-phosphotransferase [Paenibacillus sp. GSMTC-2017]|nr:macrolide 2'-phosphotransferase [Paenibacillus sp. GSMTC-2017]
MNGNDSNVIISLALSHGITLDPSSITFNDSGLDFLAMLAKSNDGVPWIFRIPRRPDVIESATYEKKVLDLVSSTLPVSVPNWEVHTSEMIAYPMLEGTPAATVNPTTRNFDWYLDPASIPEIFVHSLAETIVALHTINHDIALNAGIRLKQPFELRQQFSETMDEIKAAFGVSESLWRRWQLWLADHSYWPDHSVLVHGDLHPGHILVDSYGRVTGLLDWTEAEVADPATDFAIYYALFGETALSELINRYEKFGGRVWPRMYDHIVELASAYPVKIASFALKSGIEEYKIMARTLLGVNEHGEEIPTK